MTDALFYTAYDDMPPAALRLRRRRRPAQRGFGGLAAVWVLAVGATALSAVPALGPGALRMPQIASRLLPAMKIAQDLPAPRHLIPASLLRPDYVAGIPDGFAETRPLASRFVAATPPAFTVAAEAPAPTRDGPVLAAVTVEPAIAGPATVTASADDEEIVPALPTAASPLVVAEVPLPTPRPTDFAPPVVREALPRATRRPTVVASVTPASPSAVAPDNRSFLEKFFNLGQSASAPASAALGYAAPEDGFFSSLRGAVANPARSYGEGTAVYEIASHTVFMPDGSRLEAHSGLGDRLDNPRFVHERMRGPTPPATYALTMRESLFHGVQALRLNPIGTSVFGRTGLLAHTFMLGPKGDSNGCVSFRDYKTFLSAFQRGSLKRLVVVAKLS